jgi:hypothetical protein
VCGKNRAEKIASGSREYLTFSKAVQWESFKARVFPRDDTFTTRLWFYQERGRTCNRVAGYDLEKHYVEKITTCVDPK